MQKYRKCNRCGWIHFVISLVKAQFSSDPFKCWKCGNSHEDFSPVDHAPLGATLQPILEPVGSQTKVEDDEDDELVDLALGAGAALLDLALSGSDDSPSSSPSSGDDSGWGGGGGEFGGGGASSDW